MDSLYVVAPAILIAIVLASVWLERWSVPVILIALGAGIGFGSDVLRWWHVDNIGLVNQVANFALILILFYGGFSTRKPDFQKVALPAGGLATWGVLLTAAITFLVLHFVLHWELELALLLAVIVSSTDAAAIFSILRRQPLRKKLSSTVEIESAANDPMAILLTVAAVEFLTSGNMPVTRMGLVFVWQFLSAPVVGWLMGRGTLWLINHLMPQERGLYYLLTLAAALLVYGAAQAVGASGMMAVFVAGFVIGNRPFVHKQGVTNFIAAFATLANVGMFVLLGLQVFPSQWGGIWQRGIVLFLVITLVARPLAVWLGTLGMKLPRPDRLFIAWAGLRGSVPIVLATYPLAAGMGQGGEIFNLVFFVVLLSIALQGGTLGLAGRWLGLTVPARPQPLFQLELITLAASDLDMIVVDLPGPRGAAGDRIADLKLPHGAVITLITRDRELVIPKGSTQLRGWDQVSVLAHADEEDLIRAALLEAFDASSTAAAR